METLEQFLPGYYRDSVALMQLSAKLSAQPGVVSASVQMATAANLDLLSASGLLASLPVARPNDLLLLVRAESRAAGQAALDLAKATLDEKKSGGGETRREPPRSITMALAEDEETNVALISTPGEFAGAEAMKALRQGLHVMLFSDNVPVVQELALKTYARDHGLLVMGPDCGTCILGGVPLAFANVVRPGPIGVIGASGTGIQQVTSLVHQYGSGISHAIGTGGHDLSQDIGGLTMLSALALLADDPATAVIVLLSKPPAEAVAARILQAAQAVPKPVVVCFLGSPSRPGDANVQFADTLEQAALGAVALVDPHLTSPLAGRSERDRLRLTPLRALVRPGSSVRGLFTGGTFCYEAQVLLTKSLGEVWSNTPTKGTRKLPDSWHSVGHTLLDLGDDDFTRGKPHPMIDPDARNERLVQEAADPTTGVVLFDLVLGHGSHPNPAGGLAAAVSKARAAAAREGRSLVFVGFVCGTDRDPQNLAQQTRLLADAGVVIAESNAHAAELVSSLGRPV